jgi:hypothetical protein
MAGIWTKGVLPRVQWGPVITGVLCALAAQIVLGLFGIAFGFAAAPGRAGMAVLAAIWGILTPIVASFIGALVAVRTAGDTLASGALLDGALVWCIGLIAGAILLAGAFGPGAMGAAGVAETREGVQQGTEVAAAGSGVVAVAALLGLGGALLGAAVGRGMVTGEGLSRAARRYPERRAEQAGTEYTQRDITPKPPEVEERRPPEERPPSMPH